MSGTKGSVVRLKDIAEKLNVSVTTVWRALGTNESDLVAPELRKKIREMAVAAFRACDLSGLARVDFLMEPDGKHRIFLNEVNTLPGFTQISMYPKLWEATGIGYSDLITRLIELGLERHAEKSRTSYTRQE